MLKMSNLSHMGAKHVAWCSPVEKSPRSGHMAHELWHDMLCFMGVCHHLLLRIWYPCMIFEWYACCGSSVTWIGFYMWSEPSFGKTA
jgi:hypothetical protein